MLQDEIIQQKRAVGNIESVCSRLKQLRPDDESLTTTVEDKIEYAARSHVSITADAETRHKMLQRALLAGQKFESTFNDFNTCLEDLEARLRGARPLDARLDVLDALVVEHEVCFKDVTLFG